MPFSSGIPGRKPKGVVEGLHLPFLEEQDPLPSILCLLGTVQHLKHLLWKSCHFRTHRGKTTTTKQHQRPLVSPLETEKAFL